MRHVGAQITLALKQIDEIAWAEDEGLEPEGG